MTNYQHARLVVKPVVIPPPPSSVGLLFGPYRLWKTVSTMQTVGVSHFTTSLDYMSSGSTGGVPDIITRINAAKAANKKLVLMMTNNSKSAYLTGGVWQLSKFKAEMDGYNTAPIKAAVAAALADGTVVGNSVMDEPQHSGWNNTVNKSDIDSMCSYVKGIFPGLPCGVATVHWWRGGIGTHTQQLPLQYFQTCDFIVDQYDWWQPPNGQGTGTGSGNVGGWITAAQAFQTRERANAADGKAPQLLMAMNILGGGIINTNYGTPGDPVGWACGADTGGFGPEAPSCRMTAAQVRSFGLALATASGARGLIMWQYDLAMMGLAVYQTEFQAIGDYLASQPTLALLRT